MSLFSDIANFANPYGTPAKGKWNLTPAIWIDSKTSARTVFFTETRSQDAQNAYTGLDQIQDSGGRRLATYEFPYQDGQRIIDMGRKGETYAFNITFHGDNYQNLYKQFYKDVYQSKNVGKLKHPLLSGIRGDIDCRLQSFDPVHRADAFNSVTFRAVFVEDSTARIDYAQKTDAGLTPQTALQKSLSDLVRRQAAISQLITSATGVLQTPASITAALQNQKASIIGQLSSLLGQLSATFASGADFLNLFAIGAGSVSDLSGGVATSRTAYGTTVSAAVQPSFQTGLDTNTQALVEAQISNFVSANQITTQQAIYASNQSRNSITEAISKIESTLGNYGYDIVLEYRALAVSMQDTVEACITLAQSKVKLFKLNRPMSLRQVAWENGLDANRQNEIESLNPYLPSVNYIPRGSVVTVPAS